MTVYIRPSECDRCVPVETISAGLLHSWIVETAHQDKCPNAPQGVTE